MSIFGVFITLNVIALKRKRANHFVIGFFGGSPRNRRANLTESESKSLEGKYLNFCSFSIIRS